MKAALSIIIALTLSTLIGYNIGWKHGATESQMFILTEIKRQCDSPWPLLLGNTFYNCKANGVVIK